MQCRARRSLNKSSSSSVSLTHSTTNPHFRTFTRTQGRVHRRNFADPASQPAQFSVTSMVSSVVTLKDIYTDSQRQTVWFVDDSTHLQTICPQSGPFVSSHPLHPGPPLFFSRGHRLAGGREMMSVGLSYGEDGSVKMAESASLVHGNLAVLQGLEGGGLAYGLVHWRYRVGERRLPGIPGRRLFQNSHRRTFPRWLVRFY